MQLKDIKIPQTFMNTQPSSTKLIDCANYYKKFGQLDKPITIDANCTLVDGYVRYLVAKKMGLTEVPVKLLTDERIYVTAKHTDVGKEYWWIVKRKDEARFSKRIKVGDKVLVHTKKGNCPVTITNIVVSDVPPIDQRIKAILKF